ncbi:Uncharacterised protein [Mycobacteroides abscessus subsp. massiliense]|nr:Uncharacterised protein [Mycobacteroides abscessus subsp. massiliense]
MAQNRYPPQAPVFRHPDRDGRQVYARLNSWSGQRHGFGEHIAAHDHDAHLPGCGGGDGDAVGLERCRQRLALALPVGDRLPGHHRHLQNVGVFADPDTPHCWNKLPLTKFHGETAGGAHLFPP